MEAEMKLSILGLVLNLSVLLSCGGDGDPTPPPPTGSSSSTYAYVSNSDSNNIIAYKINSATGTLSPVGTPIGGVDAPLGLALAPNSDLLAVGNLNGGRISLFRVDKTTGSIAATAGSPFPASGNGFPIRGQFHPSGKYYYVGLQQSASSDVAGYAVDSAAGTLSPLPGSPFPGESSLGTAGVNSLAIQPNGNFLYTSGVFFGIAGYAVDASGAITPLPGSPFAPGASRYSNTTMVIHPSGKFLYMADFDADGIRVFPLAADGSVSAEIAGSPFSAGTGTRDITLDPSGTLAYAINDGDRTVTAFSVNTSTGALTFIGNADTGIGPFSLTVDSSGKFLYVTNQGDGNVSAYSINASTGALGSVSGSSFVAANSPISIVTTK
jgi:6-phosphogluconolactonase